MSIKKIKAWVRGVRPFSFTGSVIPVILGAVFAARETGFLTGYFILSVIAILLLHGGVNLISDYDDYKNKVDTEESYGSSGVIREKWLTAEEVLKGGKFLLIMGAAVGVFLSVERGWTVLAIGLSGAYLGYSYTAKPLKLKYRGLGAPLVFLLFGPMMTIGSYYVQAQKLTAEAFFISIPVGLLTTAILHANDIRDIQFDKIAGIKTLSIMIGRNKARSIYYALIYVSYVSVLMMVLYRIIPVWSIACLITFPAALKNMNKLRLIDKGSLSAIIALDKETAELHAKFGILFILSIIVSLIIR